MDAVNEYDLVEPRYACPCCGERREDYLEWQEDDTVKRDLRHRLRPDRGVARETWVR